ncbi:hypothetical protein [Ktedonospora formicarum]|uniref:Uncharacterized protein n=1 Tax=Ktedonospora formicarum TaxID=2778364 RepID=A0A8J3MY45_9CHLR|nr:hypothetical protein [Ktedonospora formicarum]GHO50398.1 hypothetical protein KSX_85610 [Ktedonospora formicarum]
MNATITLQETIEHIYTTFASYLLHHPVEGCPHCVSHEDQERIASKPLRELTEEDLRRYTLKALTTWGDVNDLKHFLPRMLELVVSHRFPYLDYICSKLNYANFERWPEGERQPIMVLVLQLWDASLRDLPQSPSSPDVLLGELSPILDDYIPFLNDWRSRRTPYALRHLAWFICGNIWQGQFQKHQQIQQWFREPATKAALEEGFDRFIDESWGNDLAEAVDILEWSTD